MQSALKRTLLSAIFLSSAPFSVCFAHGERDEVANASHEIKPGDIVYPIASNWAYNVVRREGDLIFVRAVDERKWTEAFVEKMQALAMPGSGCHVRTGNFINPLKNKPYVSTDIIMLHVDTVKKGSVKLVCSGE